MEYIISHPQCPNEYKIKESSNGLSFEVFKGTKGRKGSKAANGKVIKSDWIPCNKYPTSLDSALRCVAKLMMMDPDSEESISIDLDKEAKKINKTFESWLKEILVKQMIIVDTE